MYNSPKSFLIFFLFLEEKRKGAESRKKRSCKLANSRLKFQKLQLSNNFIDNLINRKQK